MKKLILLLIAMLTIPSLINAQTQKSGNAVPNKSEIDRLYEKYKDNDSIILYTAFGELNGYVTINYNSDEKPESIRIFIETTNREAAAKFIEDLIQQKLKNGYKVPGGVVYSTEWNFKSIEDNLDIPENFESMKQKYYFNKGKMYTTIITHCIDKGYDFSYKSVRHYEVEIETGDQSRFGGKKATEFEF